MSFCPTTYNVKTQQTDGVYNAKRMYHEGKFVVGLAFTNLGDGPIQFVDKFTLPAGKGRVEIPIPCGTCNAEEWQFIFMTAGTINNLQIEETIALAPKQSAT